MSADNWRECPKCKVLCEQEKQIKIQKVAESYDKVPESEYKKMVKELSKERDEDQNVTLREDWELYIEEGTFHCSYYASCEICGFSFDYEHKEKLKLD